MIIIPAIDLRGGRVVRLQQGDYDRETRYTDDPVELAERYQTAGASYLHVVDLDSARAGGDANLETIGRICRALDIPVQTGGGVRSLDDLKRRLDLGASRVVVGSLCVREPGLVCEWLDHLSAEQLVAGLDVARDFSGSWVPRASGWTEEGSLTLVALLDRLIEAGLQHLLCTDIERDGMFSGPSIALYRSITERYSGLAVQASGGIGEPADLQEVARTSVAACIVGRALLENRVPMTAIKQWSR
jgi:phosphoribosylformimino-5-aminoimidazole carboxamide ribotide isomerase